MNEVMRYPIYVLDDFHPYPEALRQHALGQVFEDWLAPDGELYRRICRMDIPGMLHLIEAAFGPVDMHGMAYRLNYNEEEPNAAIHSDLGWGTHAMVYYLSEGPGGTAFWKHRRTGCHRIDTGDTWLFEQVNHDWNTESAWEQHRLVDMKFNRALFYEGSLFHSRWPFKAFGDSPETGRLIVVAFFTPRRKS